MTDSLTAGKTYTFQVITGDDNTVIGEKTVEAVLPEDIHLTSESCNAEFTQNNETHYITITANALIIW